MDKKYKVEKSEKLSTKYDIRYVVVDLEGKVIDDAQGWGYKSIKNAYAAYSYKTASEEDKRKRETKKETVRKWCKKHKEFINLLECFQFEIAKGSWGPDDKFDKKFVGECFNQNGFRELPFTISEFLKYWQ